MKENRFKARFDRYQNRKIGKLGRSHSWSLLHSCPCPYLDGLFHVITIISLCNHRYSVKGEIWLYSEGYSLTCCCCFLAFLVLVGLSFLAFFLPALALTSPSDSESALASSPLSSSSLPFDFFGVLLILTLSFVLVGVAAGEDDLEPEPERDL